jgi:hypothetical protein
MLTMIIKHQFKDQVSGCEGADFFTIDFENAEIEACLTSGGRSEYGYDRCEFVGVEIKPMRGWDAPAVQADEEKLCCCGEPFNEADYAKCPVCNGIRNTIALMPKGEMNNVL